LGDQTLPFLRRFKGGVSQVIKDQEISKFLFIWQKFWGKYFNPLKGGGLGGRFWANISFFVGKWLVCDKFVLGQKRGEKIWPKGCFRDKKNPLF